MATIRDTVRLNVEFRNFDDALVSPDNVKLLIYGSGRKLIDTIENIAPVSTGKYICDYTVTIEGPVYYEFEGVVDGKPIVRGAELKRLDDIRLAEVETRATYLEWINDYCNQEYTEDNMPGGVKLALADLMRMKLLPVGAIGVTSHSAAELSMGFHMGAGVGPLPEPVRANLVPYRRMPTLK